MASNVENNVDYFLNKDHNQILECVYDIYNSGHNFNLISEIRSIFNLKISKHTNLQKEFLNDCFMIAINDVDHIININKYEDLIDSNFRVYLFLNYLVDSKQLEQAKVTFNKNFEILNHEQRKQIHNAIYCSENCKFINLLEDSQYIKATYYSNENYDRPLIISFDPIDSHKRIESYGIKFCIENGFDIVHFAHAKQTQYQYLSRKKFKSVIKDIVKKYNGTICYGSSLGGYASLYYSDVFNSDVVALSPYDPFHPEIVSHYNIDVSNRLPVTYSHDIRNTPKTKGKVLITLDRKKLSDDYFFQIFLLNKFKDADIFYADYTGHPITTILSITKQIKHVVLTAFNEKRWDIDFCSIKKSAYYYYSMYLSHKRIGDSSGAISALSKAIEIEDSETYRAELNEYINSLNKTNSG